MAPTILPERGRCFLPSMKTEGVLVCEGAQEEHRGEEAADHGVHGVNLALELERCATVDWRCGSWCGWGWAA